MLTLPQKLRIMADIVEKYDLGMNDSDFQSFDAYLGDATDLEEVQKIETDIQGFDWIQLTDVEEVDDERFLSFAIHHRDEDSDEPDPGYWEAWIRRNHGS